MEKMEKEKKNPLFCPVKPWRLHNLISIFSSTDYNECNDFSNDCPLNASCVNSDGFYSCRCPVGFRLDVKNCSGLSNY